MKFNLGRLGVEVLLSWNDHATPIPIPEHPVVPDLVVVPPSPITISGTIPDSVRLTVYKITSAFEGGKYGEIYYDNLTGNFDGQGLSIGFLQWCIGQGSDLPLFQRMRDLHPEALRRALGGLYAEFVQHMWDSLGNRLEWATVHLNTESNRIENDWHQAFTNLCLTKEFQEVQLYFANKILEKAASLCKEYGLKTVRGLMLMFDIVTQNGSIRTDTKTTIFSAKALKEKALGRALTEKEFLEIIAIKRAEAAKPEWVYDVKSRKLCIVYGKGTVHGDTYNLDNLGLSDNPFFS